MSDGHTDGRPRWHNRAPDIKDAAGHDVLINDPVWIATEDGSLIRANVLEIFPEGYISLMTRSNSIVEVTFKPKAGTIPTCNQLLKA